MSTQNYQDYRREYEAEGLRRRSLALNPWQQFSDWMEAAEVACPLNATSMALATASASGMPRARRVLMKSYNDNGVVWYNDIRSYNGQEISQNTKASVLIYLQAF
jgi:pyridoxamine 5'-phosphate oxidase